MARQKDAADLQKEVREELKIEVNTLNKKVEKLEQTNADLQKSLNEQVQTQTSERKYYRETISDLREDSRNALQIAVNAQTQYEGVNKEKLELAQHNQHLSAAIASQKETIGQLHERLNNLTQERERLITQLSELKSLEAENNELKRLKLELETQLQNKTSEINGLQKQLDVLELQLQREEPATHANITPLASVESPSAETIGSGGAGGAG